MIFCKLCAPTHALNHLLPPTRNRASLRTRGHSYQLPEYSTDLHTKSFLIRSLYSFVKWNSFYSFFGFAALYCTSFWLCFLCLLFVVWCAFVASHARTVLRECCKGDDESQWERGKFDPPPPKNPLTDGHQNLCTELRRGYLPPCKILSKSI